MSPRLIGIQNGSAVFIFWFGAGIFLVSDWVLAMPIFSAYLFPIALVVAWRSEKLANDLSKKLATIRTYALEGFGLGFSICIVFWFWSLSNQAIASGYTLDGASYLDIIKFVLLVSLPVSVFVGLLGAIQSVMFFYLNRRQLAAYYQV